MKYFLNSAQKLNFMFVELMNTEKCFDTKEIIPRGCQDLNLDNQFKTWQGPLNRMYKLYN